MQISFSTKSGKIPPRGLSKRPVGKPLAAFSHPDDDLDEHPVTDPTKPKPSGKAPVSKANQQPASLNNASQETTAPAVNEDPSVYDYDGVYDSLKAVERQRKALDEQDALERKPKYMENLLASAELRQRDLLRAKEKLLQREREAEGDEFKDKESFVTGAYKKQQEEIHRLEEEERLREEALKKRSQGMSTFHRNMLDTLDNKHDAILRAARQDATVYTTTEPEADTETELQRRARELKEQGAFVDMNEEGQVVDKTQLLSGGLNISVTKTPSRTASIRERSQPLRPTQHQYSLKRQQQAEMRARQSNMLEAQLAETRKRAVDDEEVARMELQRQSKSRKTEGEVSSAKQRYLQRKAARQNAGSS